MNAACKYRTGRKEWGGLSGQTVAPEGKKAENRGKKLPEEHSGQISFYAGNGDRAENEEKAQQEAGHAQAEGIAGFSEPVKDAGKGGVQIEKRTEKAQHHDELAGKPAVKKEQADPLPGAQEQKAADTAKGEAEKRTFPDRPADQTAVALRVRFGNGRHEQDRYGVGQRAWEKDQREGHSGQHAVYAQGFADGIAVYLQLGGNTGRLHGLKEIDAQAVQAQRGGKGKHPPGQGGKVLAADRKKTQRKRPDMEMETGGADGEQHGSKFPCDHTGCRDGDRQLPAVLKEQKGEDPDASHTDKLFKKLRRGRDGGFPKAVKISVDTGMDGGKRKDRAAMRRSGAQRGSKSRRPAIKPEQHHTPAAHRQEEGREKSSPTRRTRIRPAHLPAGSWQAAPLPAANRETAFWIPAALKENTREITGPMS